MTVLLDSSVLIAAALTGHVHYDAADRWLDTLDGAFATCPITQGALIRESLRSGYELSDALTLVEQISASDRHEFWPDDLGYQQVNMNGVVGHRQVTDAYLAQLARERGERVATLDRGFAALHADVAELVPTS